MTNLVGTTLNDLPPVLALNGSELCFLYQFDPMLGKYVTYSCTTFQIAQLAFGIGGEGVCSMRQLFAAMANQGVMYQAFEQLPADVTNTFNIAWNHAFIMTINDPFIQDFLQPALGYSDLQMTALFALALTFPT